jgi:peptide/nickel transport system substrate-binding protein
MLVKREWEQAGKKPFVSLQTDAWRHIFTQFRNPAYPEMLDVRLRRGLLHAIDRHALTASLLEGETPVADSFVYPADPKWEWVKNAVVPVEYDPRRAQELLAEAGWTRGSDGTVTARSGERVSLPLWTIAGQETEKTIVIVADYWKAVGVPVDQYVIPRARARDLEHRASFRGFYYAGISAERFNVLRRMEGRECPRAETQWIGSALGCYQNPQMDRVVDALQQAIDPGEQRRLWREATEIHAVEQPVLPMFFALLVVLFRDGVTGPRPHPLAQTELTWNIAEWDIR